MIFKKPLILILLSSVLALNLYAEEGEPNLKLIEEQDEPESQSEDTDIIHNESPFAHMIIKQIIIEGNKYVKKQAILHRLPYKVGQEFDDQKRGIAIRNIYDLDSFHQVRLDGEKIDDNNMKLYVVVEEKKLLELYQRVIKA